MKVFLASSISHEIDPDSGLVFPSFRHFMDQLLTGLRAVEDIEVFCAIEYEDWKVSEAPPELGVQHDLEELKSADMVVALLHDKPSVGVEFEIGFAVGYGKPVVLVRHISEPLAYFNQGVVSSGLASYVSYEHMNELLSQLEIALRSPTA
jgi:hypothetical protein